MKPALRTALGQQLALTPQLRQAIKLEHNYNKNQEPLNQQAVGLRL